MEARFAAAQAPRSSHSGDGSVPAGRRPVTSTIRSAARSTRAPNQSGWALMSPAPPASSSASRSARAASITTSRLDDDRGQLLEARARARRDDGRVGHEIQRRPQLGLAGRERDVPAALAHDELRGGDVDGAAAPQREHPVDAGVGDLRHRHGDRPDRADAADAALEALDAAGDPVRRGGLERDELQAAVAVAALRRHVDEGSVVQAGALPAAGPPLLAGAEVVHVGELDVGHRGAAGDGDRDARRWAGRASRSASRRSGR